MDARRILLEAKNNKQINNRHGRYYMNLHPGWRALMHALTGRVLQINGQAGAPVLENSAGGFKARQRKSVSLLAT